MNRLIFSKNQQTLLDVLYQEFGSDSDLLEEQAHLLNPQLALLPVTLPDNTPILLPTIEQTETLPVQEYWD